MRLVLSFDFRLDGLPDGSVWWDGTLDYHFWRRYLEVFDALRLVARVRDVREVGSHARRIDGPGVTIFALPHFHGPQQYALRLPQIRAAAAASFEPGDALLLRVPSAVSYLVEAAAWRVRRPYAIEVIGDPYTMFAPGNVGGRLRPVLRWWFTRRLRQICGRARAALYVTQSALQERYPPAPGAYAVGCSDVDLPASAFADAPRPVRLADGAFRLLFIGSVALLHKAPDLLIEAVAQNIKVGLDWHLCIVGDGGQRPYLEQLARDRGIAERVRFTGQLAAGAPVLAELDRADVLVLPSRTEGLPRTVPEAMARALPCVATAVGGIPELLAAEDLVPPGDLAALSAKLREVAGDPQRLARMSARNLARAQEYGAEALWSRRRAFFEAVRERASGDCPK